jgi:hypothetical protein
VKPSWADCTSITRWSPRLAATPRSSPGRGTTRSRAGCGGVRSRLQFRTWTRPQARLVDRLDRVVAAPARSKPIGLRLKLVRCWPQSVCYHRAAQTWEDCFREVGTRWLLRGSSGVVTFHLRRRSAGPLAQSRFPTRTNILGTLSRPRGL